MSKQTTTAAGGALSLERLVFFSDAVFAIAITLLVLEIHVPRLSVRATTDEYWVELVHLFPSFFGFVLSFLVIGLFWMGHHRVFDRAKRYDAGLMWPNMLFLMAVAFMPFATAFMSANANVYVPALVYNMTLLGCALAIWWLSRRVAALSAGGDGHFEIDRASVTVLAAMLCVALSFIIPQWSQTGMILTVLGPRWAARREAKR